MTGPRTRDLTTESVHATIVTAETGTEIEIETAIRPATATTIEIGDLDGMTATATETGVGRGKRIETEMGGG
jgi:hypothetical protein